MSLKCPTLINVLVTTHSYSGKRKFFLINVSDFVDCPIFLVQWNQHTVILLQWKELKYASEIKIQKSNFYCVEHIILK